MSDISKCRGDGCGIKEKCHRYTAKSGVWQAYIATPKSENGCEMFYDNKDM